MKTIAVRQRRLVARRIPEVGSAVFDADTDEKVSPPGERWFTNLRRAKEELGKLIAATEPAGEGDTVIAKAGTYVKHNGRRLRIEFAPGRRDLLQAFVDDTFAYEIPGGLAELMADATLTTLREHADRLTGPAVDLDALLAEGVRGGRVIRPIRLSIGARISRACRELGIPCESPTVDGYLGYVVAGRRMMTKEAADYLFEGGCDAAWGDDNAQIREERLLESVFAESEPAVTGGGELELGPDPDLLGLLDEVFA